MTIRLANRRRFFQHGVLTLLLTLALSWLASQSASAAVHQVIVVFKTHFDIGYTDMASNVVQRYRTTMLDKALQVVDQNRDLPSDRQFVWTLAGWPMHKILEDWPGQEPERKQRIQQALKEGRFVVHALPFTTHTELLEAEDLVRGLGYSSSIARSLGLQLPRDGKMTDVPEHTWMLPTLLHHAGIDFIAIGCNGMSGAPQVPPLFWWEGPDGSRVLTRYSLTYGTQLIPDADWPYQTWLAVIHTGDNHGPPKPEEVKKLLDRAARELPGVKLRIGRMSDFYDAILAEKPNLPVVRSDTPDTWIHGPMSDPAGAKLARNTRPLIAVTESLNTQLRAWGTPVSDAAPAISAAYEQSLLYGEHTWGGSIGWIKNRLSFGEEFKQDRANGRFTRIEGSWDEHSAYIQNASRIITPVLNQNLQALAQGVSTAGKRIVVYNPLPWKRSGLVTLRSDNFTPAALKPADGGKASPVEISGTEIRFFAQDLPPMGYRTYIPTELPSSSRITHHASRISSPFFQATLSPTRGIILSLIDKHSGRELADTNAPVGLGQYLYERFDGNQVTQYCRAYLKRNGMHADFFKPGLPPADQAPYQAASPKDFKLRFEETPVSISAIMEAATTTNLPAVTTRLTLYHDLLCADLEITLHDKPFEPWPEAGWLCLPLKIDQPRFHLGRLASIIDPACDIIPGANRNILALNTGLALTDPQGRGVGLCSPDLPLVSLDTPGCWKFSRDFVSRKPIVYLNLFNNQWDTNFRLWNQGTWTTRVRLWAFNRFSAEPALISPSLESRYPLQAAFTQADAGSLPPTSRGLELSRKGILVTAFGANPDGPGTLLRLWEYSGNSGQCQIRLPAALDAKSVQPVDLRGRPIGHPLKVRNHKFTAPLPAFAPASLLLQ